MTDRWTDDPQVQADPALEEFLRGLSSHADGSVDPATRTATLEAMLATAAEASPGGAPGWSWGRRARRVLGLTGVKLALAAGVAAATTTGGLAATGSLPAPMQEFAHDLGQRIGIGVPAAPGQLQQSDGDPDTTGRDHAPGQLKKSDGDPGTTGRDHAPGQRGDRSAPGSDDAPLEQEAPVSPDDADAEQRDDTVRRDDEGASNRVEPDDTPPADTVPEDAGQPEVDPDQSRDGQRTADPSPPPEPEAPAGAATQSTPDPAQQPGPSDSPPADQRQDPAQDSGRDDAPADDGKADERSR